MTMERVIAESVAIHRRAEAARTPPPSFRDARSAGPESITTTACFDRGFFQFDDGCYRNLGTSATRPNGISGSIADHSVQRCTEQAKADRCDDQKRQQHRAEPGRGQGTGEGHASEWNDRDR